MQKITTETIVNKNLEKVWNTYTDPKSMTGWAFANEDWECPYAENDLKVGGRFLTRMSAKDKSFGFDITGTYSKIEPHKQIEYKMDKSPNESQNREVEVLFTDLEHNQTKVVVIFDSEDINPIDMQQEGWQNILNNFKKFVENN